MLGAALPIEIELLLQGDVGQQRQDDDAPAVLGRELVRPVRRSTEVTRNFRVGNGTTCDSSTLEVLAVVREPLVRERSEQEVDRLLVPRARVLVERTPAFSGSQPWPRPTPNS